MSATGENGDFVILYGSHTGQAEAISQQIKEKAELVGLKPRWHILDDNEKTFNIENEKLVVIVVSSTGDGDAPENCARFVRRINRKTLEANFLANVDYALLGLGDSNYSSYQAIPKKLDKQFQALGANKIMEIGEADDQVGLELSVEPWIERLFQKLAERFNIDNEKLSGLLSTKIALNPVKSKEEKDKIAESLVIPADSMDTGDADGSEDTKSLLAPLHYEYPEVSLVKGDAKLSGDANLRVPIAPQPFLCSAVTHKQHAETPEFKAVWQNGCKMVGVVSAPRTVTVVGTAILTDFDAGKPKREIVVDLGEHESELGYEPGDAFYFVAPNNEKEVNFILDRMGLLSIADRVLNVSVDSSTKKLNATVPGHIPPTSSLRHLLTNCLDIRRAPGRPLLRVMAESASSESERRRLLELCSAQGMNDFTVFIRQAGLSVADVLLAFPSVKPEVDRLIELLPRLMPRPYSMSSARGKRVRFVYSVMKFSAEEGRRYERFGMATEWLLNLHVGDKIQIMAKEAARFRLPPPPMTASSVASMPLLMIGPGTGVAVFLAFCQHLLKLKLSDPSSFADVPRYLYFGCRNVKKDFIYKDEMESYVREGVLTDLIVCESQPEKDEGRPCYVQDALKLQSERVSSFLSLTDGEPSRVFVCGDAKGMSKDVWACFHSLAETAMGKSEADAKAYMLELKKTDRYIEDVWS